MSIFNSYVSLPEGKFGELHKKTGHIWLEYEDFIWLQNNPHIGQTRNSQGIFRKSGELGERSPLTCLSAMKVHVAKKMVMVRMGWIMGTEIMVKNHV